MSVSSIAGEDPPGWVLVGYEIEPGGRNHLHLRQGPTMESIAERLVGWERRAAGGREVLVEVPRRHPGTRVFVRVHDVPVFVYGDLPQEALVSVAGSLELADE